MKCRHGGRAALWFLAAVMVTGGARLGLAKGDAGGSLGTGGVAHGDISKTAGETDHITLDLTAGTPLRIKFNGSLHAALGLSDPDGAPVRLGATPGTRFSTVVTADKPGTYTFTVASADGSQGLYTLVAKPAWTRRVRVTGTGAASVGVPMPPAGRLSGRIGKASGAAVPPRIVALSDPNGVDLLPSVIEPQHDTARLIPTSTPTGGVYVLSVSPSDGQSAWSGTLLRAVPRQASAVLMLSNGLDAVSFAGDGVRSVFNRCTPCHGWAGSYGSARGYAAKAYGKMQSGSMPPGGGLSRAEVALVKAWIATGKKP